MRMHHHVPLERNFDSYVSATMRQESVDISEVTKSHPKGDDDIKFSMD